MERRSGIAGPCIVVAVALSAVIAVTAQASPEIVSCYKTVKVEGVYKGHYKNKTCTEKASEEEVDLGGRANKYEFDAGEKWTVKGKTVKLVSAEVDVVCSKSAGSGTVLTPTQLSGVFRFNGCTERSSEPLPIGCNTYPESLEKDEINTRRLIGVIGEGAGGEVLVSFTRQAGTEPAPQESFAEFQCGGPVTSFNIYGTLSGRWTEAVNKTTKKGGIDFAVGTGEQELIEQFSNPISDELEEDPATLESTQSYKFADKYEMRQE